MNQYQDDERIFFPFFFPRRRPFFRPPYFIRPFPFYPYNYYGPFNYYY